MRERFMKAALTVNVTLSNKGCILLYYHEDSNSNCKTVEKTKIPKWQIARRAQQWKTRDRMQIIEILNHRPAWRPFTKKGNGRVNRLRYFSVCQPDLFLSSPQRARNSSFLDVVPNDKVAFKLVPVSINNLHIETVHFLLPVNNKVRAAESSVACKRCLAN